MNKTNYLNTFWNFDGTEMFAFEMDQDKILNRYTKYILELGINNEINVIVNDKPLKEIVPNERKPFKLKRK